MAAGRGVFITFEGGEGAGKSTQIRRLEAALRTAGYDPLMTREPGGSPTAEAIRNLLLSGRARPLGILGEAYLFAAARIDHLAETIQPALAAGRIVLCDRFADSTRVYQGTAGGLDATTIDALEQAAICDFQPDLTFILDVPVEMGLARAASRSGFADRFESDTRAMHERRRDGFLEIAKANPERCVVIDAAQSVEAISASINDVLGSRLGINLSTAG